MPRVKLIRLEPLSALLREEASPFQRRKGLPPLFNRLRGLVVEQPGHDVAAALSRAAAHLKPPCNIMPKFHGGVRHKLKMHHALARSRSLGIAPFFQATCGPPISRVLWTPAIKAVVTGRGSRCVRAIVSPRPRSGPSAMRRCNGARPHPFCRALSQAVAPSSGGSPANWEAA